MRTAAVLIAGFLLACCAAIAQTNVTAQTEPNQAVGFPMTGIASADLELTFQHLQKLVPTEASILNMIFQNPDNASVTLREHSRDTTAVEFHFRRLNGTWKKSEQREVKPYPGTGIVISDFQKAISEIKSSLPGKEILQIRVEGPTTVSVWTGIQYGPRSGSGTFFYFNKLNGKWNKSAGEGGRWVS